MNDPKKINPPSGIRSREDWTPYRNGEAPFDYIQRDIEERVKRDIEKKKKQDDEKTINSQ